MNTRMLAGRDVGEVYSVRRRKDIHSLLLRAVEASGARLLYSSTPDRAPVFLGVQVDTDERIGLLVYPFRITQRRIRNRPDDEVRGQLRYGSESSWERDHPVAHEVAGVDVTLILGIDPVKEIFLGLDAQLWDPLPMGISFYAKEEHFAAALKDGWHVWEKDNRSGKRRVDPRSPTHLETLVAFKPERLLDYALLERRASSLGLDQPLRHSAALTLSSSPQRGQIARQHRLEEQFDLRSEEILDLISERNRLSVAVRGGVAERHLAQLLERSESVVEVKHLDKDGQHDFDVSLNDGTVLRVECKNASPNRTADGSFKVEVQKTRTSKNDPASRFYPVSGFDVVAACLFSATGRWIFRFGVTAEMPRHQKFPDRLAPIQHITEAWTDDIASLMGRL
ncbi:MAG: hypothetical protein GX596_09190 [Propionibacterium sp.]|nr:hypothetical protein [Propionibacterium sp.]